MASVEETRQYFDELASSLGSDSLVNKWPAIEPMFGGVDTNAHVVECGAGTGLFTIPLLERGCSVTAVDLSEASLTLLQEAVRRKSTGLEERLRIVEGDFLAVAEFLIRPVDVVTFIKVLHHFPDVESISRAISTAIEILSPGGRVVVFEPNGACPFWEPLLRARGQRHWEAEKNYRLIRKAVFTDVSERHPLPTTCSVTYRYLIPGSLSTRVPPFDGLDRALCRIPGLRTLAGNIGLVIKKLPGGAAQPDG